MDSAPQSFEHKRKTGSVLFAVAELVDDEGTIDSLSFGALATNFSTSESTQRNARVSVDEIDQQIAVVGFNKACNRQVQRRTAEIALLRRSKWKLSSKSGRDAIKNLSRMPPQLRLYR